MLQAILHGKRLGSGLGVQDQCLSPDNAFGAEDILTATVFERISYLPKHVLNAFWQLLVPEVSGLDEVIEFHFWPQLELEGRRVEPDVIIETADVLLIIEAKRHDGSQMQMHDQLYRELLACRQHFQRDHAIVLLGIGGMKRYDPEEEAAMEAAIISCEEKLGDFRFLARSWAGLFRALAEACESDSEVGTGSTRILRDIAQVYHWHGLRTHPDLYINQLESISLKHSVFPAFAITTTPTLVLEEITDFLSGMTPIGIRHTQTTLGQ